MIQFSIHCLFKHGEATILIRVLFHLEMVDKMCQGVIDSLDVVGCNYLLQVLPQLQAIAREVRFEVYVSILALVLKSFMKFQQLF